MTSSFQEKTEAKQKEIFLFYSVMNKNKRLDLKDILSKSILKKEHSHKINGRWKNQYIDLDLISEIKPVF